MPCCASQVAAIVMAIVTLVASKDGRGAERGKGLAKAALGVSGLWTVLLCVLITIEIANNAKRDDDGTITQAGDVSVSDLQPGDCLTQVPPKRAVMTVKVAPCSNPHRAEVFAEFTLDDGNFPGEKSVTRLASGGCVKRFSAYIGRKTSRSKLEVSFYSPSEDQWGYDRQVTCLAELRPKASSVTGTLEGSRR